MAFESVFGGMNTGFQTGVKHIFATEALELQKQEQAMREVATNANIAHQQNVELDNDIKTGMSYLENMAPWNRDQTMSVLGQMAEQHGENWPQKMNPNFLQGKPTGVPRASAGAPPAKLVPGSEFKVEDDSTAPLPGPLGNIKQAPQQPTGQPGDQFQLNPMSVLRGKATQQALTDFNMGEELPKVMSDFAAVGDDMLKLSATANTWRAKLRKKGFSREAVEELNDFLAPYFDMHKTVASGKKSGKSQLEQKEAARKAIDRWAVQVFGGKIGEDGMLTFDFSGNKDVAMATLNIAYNRLNRAYDTGSEIDTTELMSGLMDDFGEQVLPGSAVDDAVKLADPNRQSPAFSMANMENQKYQELPLGAFAPGASIQFDDEGGKHYIVDIAAGEYYMLGKDDLEWYEANKDRPGVEEGLRNRVTGR